MLAATRAGATKVIALLVPTIIDDIVALGRAQIDREVCGVITPHGEVIELPNRAKDPTDAYEIHREDLHRHWDPDCIIWHTHPSGFVGPSRGDMETRHPGLNYLVVTLDGIATRF